MLQGEFVDQEFMQKLQILIDSRMGVGAALTMVDGEPAATRSLMMSLEHRLNLSGDDETTLTHFGLDDVAATNLTGQLLVGIRMAFGAEMFADLLRWVDDQVAEAITNGDVSPEQ